MWKMINTVIRLCVQMLLKKVSSSDIPHPQNTVKPSHAEGFLKAVDSSQEQTMQELLMQLDSVLTMKVILSFSFFPLSSFLSFICFSILHNKHRLLLWICWNFSANISRPSLDPIAYDSLP
jgi:hypothetical protein